MLRDLVAAGLVLALVAARPASASTASDICPPAINPCLVATAKVVTPGSTLDFGTRQLDVTPNGSITVTAGQLTILAGSVRLETRAKLIGITANGTAATINVVTSGDIRVDTGSLGDATIDASDSDSPGEIDFLAHGDVVIAGDVTADQTADNSFIAGSGIINVTADGNVTISGSVTTTAGANGTAGQVTVMAGGSATVTGTVGANGGYGGDIEIDALNGDLTSSGTYNASAADPYGDGGSVSLKGSRNLNLSGQVVLSGRGDVEDGGGSGGDVDLEATAGTLTMNAAIDNHGATPDGDGGDTDITAGTDYLHGGSINGKDIGSEGSGGEVDITAGSQANFTGDIDVSGGFEAGDVFVDSTSLSVGSTGDLVASATTVAGTIGLSAENLTVAGGAQAIATTSAGTGGLVQLTSCSLDVPNGGSLRSNGVGGENLLQASGQMTIGGTLTSYSGENRFEYRNVAKPPIIYGSASVNPTRDCAPASGCYTPSLLPCAVTAVCGNHVVEPGEECDDGNTTACDGCSPSCNIEVCGNGEIECDEECDDGASNGVLGDACDANCHAVQAANLVYIPGARRGRRGCMLEWALENTATPGFPSSSQTCLDGDPACDFDGAIDGVCTLHVSACLNVTDARLPKCSPRTIKKLKIRAPNPLRPHDAVEADNATQLLDALKGLGVEIRSGTTVLQAGTPDVQTDHCTSTFVQRVPHAPGASARRVLSTSAASTTGQRKSNRIAVTCLPNPAVCGNGVVEIGEQCEDGNTVSCDGCSATCHRERCGNGILDCGEQCDDGASNGTPGDPCTTTCIEAPPANRLPGGARSRECIQEFALATGQLQLSRNGLPSTKQICVDGDPSCDFDPTPGTCRFRLWTCLGGADPRVDCAATGVSSLTLTRPGPNEVGPTAAARSALLTVFDALALPLDPGETCSARADLDVPAGRKLLVKTQATTVEGIRDRDTLRLYCAPAGTVLRSSR